ncbi:MAG: TRAP transporter large permease subunit [Dehalococcoidales bacterium]|nr:TRAP transporter large permease subunit [Dehalococcoidales bacterium]
MSAGVLTLIFFLSLTVLLFTGLPVAFCLMGVSVAGYMIFVAPTVPSALYSTAFRTLITDVFIAIPLFIFMATILEFSGIVTALFDTMHKWMEGFRGGLAIATILACTIIAAMTGISATATVTMGLIAYPEMRKRGYSKQMAIGAIPFGGALGPLIPPSIYLIVVGGFAGLSIGKLFMGGVIPGMLMSLFACTYVSIACLVKPNWGPALPKEDRATWNEKFLSLKGIILPILLIALVLGGIYGGIFTPTEASAIGAVGALVCSVVYRKLNWKAIKTAAISAMKLDAMVLLLMVGGAMFSSLLSITAVNDFVSQILSGSTLTPVILVSMMMLIVFVMGMFIDQTAIAMITLPIFIPVVYQIGVDPLYFCLLFTVCAMSGFITPPFGITMFYFMGLGHKDVTMNDVYRSIWPYVGVMTIVLILCIVFPQILLWLPNAMIK